MTRDRLPPLPPEDLTDAQRDAAEAFAAARGAPVFGPFVPLLRSPELLHTAERMGAYLRYRSALPLQLSEFAILIVARIWSQPVEWAIHRPIAVKAGLAPAIAQAIAEGRRPPSMSAEEAAIYDFSMELNATRAVGEATYARALALFGERGVVDLTGLNGYYAFLAMIMNVAGTPAPDGAEPLPPVAATLGSDPHG